MSDRNGVPTAAVRLVEALLAQGVDHVFCVPGESYLPVLDALGAVSDRIRVIVCRHEAGAANMAEAYGKLTGRPGVCMVTRGPGAAHAAIGVHTAEQDSTPLILFVGQVALADRGRGAFQEVDYARTFSGLAKWAAEIDSPDRVCEFVERAFATALQGRRGPVVLALPEDMLSAPSRSVAGKACPVARSGLDPAAVAGMAEALEAAQRPLLILGGSGWSDAAAQTLADFARLRDLPILLSFRRKDLIDNAHPCYAGDLGLGANPQLIERVRSADLLITLGARLGENATQGYGLFGRDRTRNILIHVHPDPNELGRVWPFRIGAVADMERAAQAVAAIGPGKGFGPWRAEARADYEAFTAPIEVFAGVNLSRICAHLDQAFGPDLIVANGAGNFAAWLHRFHRHRRRGSQLAPTSGAMGYGVPAAVAASLVAPDRPVVCLAGDGDFMMSVQELATAAQYGARPIIMVADNGSYGTIRMHQERAFPGRVVATDLDNPDFVALGRSFGAFAARVETTDAFPDALARARASGRLSLLHLVCDKEAIAPGRTLSQLRAQRT